MMTAERVRDAATLAGDGHASWSASAYLEPLVPAPAPQAELGVVPHRWRFRDLRRLCARDGAPALALVNPGLAGSARTTRTMICSVAHLEPGAAARSAAGLAGMRVVLEGEAHFTPLAGAAIAVSRGEVLPARAGEWTAGGAGVLWLECTDLPLVAAVSPESVAEPLERSGATLSAEARHVDPGGRTPSVRASAGAVVVVLAGSGTSVVGGWRFRWDPGDVFVVPPRAPVDHRADAPADLLVVSDAPALAALGLAWSETLPAPQPIENTFD